MLDRLLTEQPNPDSANIDSLPIAGILEVINRADQEVPAAVAAEIPRIAQAVEAIVAALQNGGRLFYMGAGTSGRLGVLDASECPPTFLVPPDLVQGLIAGGDSALRRSSEGAEDNPQQGAADLIAAGFAARDVLVGIAASGRTPYVLGAVAKAREMAPLRAASVVHTTRSFRAQSTIRWSPNQDRKWSPGQRACAREPPPS